MELRTFSLCLSFKFFCILLAIDANDKSNSSSSSAYCLLVSLIRLSISLVTSSLLLDAAVALNFCIVSCKCMFNFILEELVVKVEVEGTAAVTAVVTTGVFDAICSSKATALATSSSCSTLASSSSSTETTPASGPSSTSSTFDVLL